jgi:hypothetical protein
MKGVAFRSVLESFTAMYTQEVTAECLKRCSAELQQAVNYQRIVAGGWYPMEWYRQLLKSFCAVTGGETCLKDLGRNSVERDVRGVYRAVVKLLSPDTIMSVYARLFSHYFTHGRLVVEERAPLYLRVKLFDCIGFDKNVYTELIASSERLMELAGGKNVRMRLLKGGKDGDSFALIEGRWT